MLIHPEADLELGGSEGQGRPGSVWSSYVACDHKNFRAT